MHVVAAANKTEKEPTKQEVFLGVKGNAQLLGMKGASVCCCFLGCHARTHCHTPFPLYTPQPCTTTHISPTPSHSKTTPQQPTYPPPKKQTETNIWKIRVQLMKPVTWIPLIWGVLCGAAASGNFEWTPEDVAKAIACMIMSGPLLTGYTQTINDWYDREIDAINEPYRPIPSGAISETEVIAQIWILLLAGIGVAYGLDAWAGHEFPVMTVLAVFGSFISYIYSAPPLKLKQSGWIGNYALGSSYIALPWWAGQVYLGWGG